MNHDRVSLDSHLYNILFGPIEKELETAERIRIVPDGPLNYLPFSALVRRGSTKQEDRMYLVEWKPIHIAHTHPPNTAPTSVNNEGRRKTEWSFLAFGAPANDSLAQPPGLLSTETTLAKAIQRDPTLLVALPGAEKEVHEIGRLFPADQQRTFTQREATETNAKNLLGSSELVHFATHGYVDNLDSMNSGLVLAHPTQPSAIDDGLLQVKEILSLDLMSTDLVVLSACETALGRDMGGEGLWSLTWSFQASGARSVISSLWRIDDEKTAEFMTSLYENLQKGINKDEALRNTQLAFIHASEVEDEDRRERKEIASPYYWASFQLYGEWQSSRAHTLTEERIGRR